MGGAVSAGEDNDELVDNLVVGEYIKSYTIEKVFRAVDRGNYFLDQCRENAYRDLAWKHDKIHISAPCIYSEVMESLKLEPGMSFLNLGSGTGYLSTMAGLLLGPYGTNHGVELHQSNVEYATDILEEFQNSSSALDKYEFCPPSFVAGNCLLLDPSSHQYDRVYCGASCPTEHENFIKNLVRVGGILVMPINDNLLQVMRTTETTFEVKNVLPVSFASLVVPNTSDELLSVKLPEKHPLPLQEVCRSVVRMILRKNIEIENPALMEKRFIKHKRKKGKKHFRRIIIPFVETNNLLQPEPLLTDSMEEEVVNEEPVLPQASSASESSVSHVILPQLSEDTDKNFILSMACDDEEEEELCVEQKPDFHVEGNQEDAIMENSEDISICKGGRRRTLTANGDSGIDNISDDSLPEESPSDSEKMNETKLDGPVGEGCSEERPRISNYLKRSVDENGGEPELKFKEVLRHRYPQSRDSSVIFKRVAFSDPDSDELEEIDSDSDVEKVPKYDEKNYLSKYTYFMKHKINLLPVPHTLKVYLNLLRPVS